MAMILARVSQDIMWRIFLTITDEKCSGFDTKATTETDETSPLLAIRMASQVCQGWRKLILASPSIWGRLIDLNLLNQRTSRWRDEVLRRTGAAPLWIRGRVVISSWSDCRKELEAYFSSILYKHWERVERLVVTLGPISENIDPVTLEVLTRKAPRLQVFSATICSHVYQNESGRDWPSLYMLFDNQAPMLRSFTLDAKVSLPDLDPGWTSNLREISLTNSIPLSQLLSALRSTPLLESLYLGQHIYKDQHSPVIIHLPHLQRWDTWANVPVLVPLIQALRPGKGCSYRLHTVGEDITSCEDLSSIKDSLVVAIENYCQTYSPKRITMSLSDWEFRIFDIDVATYPSTLNVMDVCYSNPFVNADQSAGPITFFLNIFTSSCFSCATELSLTAPYLSKRETALHAPFQLLLESSFSSVTKLDTTLSSIDVIHRLSQNHSSALLPNVVTLTTRSHGLGQGPARSSGVLGAFLEWRKGVGFPIAIHEHIEPLLDDDDI